MDVVAPVPWHSTSGPRYRLINRVVDRLVDYAKKEKVSQIVVGSSQRSRWQELSGGGSIVGRVSRLAAQAGIDVHIIALPEDDR